MTVYRAVVGQAIAVPVSVQDPDNDPLRLEVAYAPAGLQLDALGQVPRLLWVPTESDVGPHFVRVVVAEATPEHAVAFADYYFEVEEPSDCVIHDCKPAGGCTPNVVPVDRPCCVSSQEPSRYPLAQLPCPQGTILLVGRNLGEGFGELRNCNRFRVINFAQIGATVRLNLATRCLSADQPIVVAARMRTANRVLFDAPRVIVRMEPTSDGFARRLGLAFPVRGPGPFFEFEGAEAELYVSAMDHLGKRVERWLRLRLTFEELPDLEDLPLVTPPWENSVPSSTLQQRRTGPGGLAGLAFGAG